MDNTIVDALPLAHFGDKEWLSYRSYDPRRVPPFVFGASIAGAICGVSPWKSALQVFLEYSGLRDPDIVNEAMRLGTDLEPAIINIYKRHMSDAGILGSIEPNDVLYGFKDDITIGATPDAFAVINGERVVVECKSTTRYRLREDSPLLDEDAYGIDGTDQVPMDVMMQVQQQMLVTGTETCHVPVLFDTRTFHVYQVKRSEKLISDLRMSLADMKRRILQEDPPAPDYEHEGTVDLLKDMYGVTEGAEIQLPDDEVVRQYLEAKANCKEADRQRTILLAQLLDYMGDAEFGHSEYGFVKRTKIGDTMWSQEDIDKAARNLGQVKRSGYTRINVRELQ